jgi:hypothetical protein
MSESWYLSWHRTITISNVSQIYKFIIPVTQEVKKCLVDELNHVLSNRICLAFRLGRGEKKSELELKLSLPEMILYKNLFFFFFSFATRGWTQGIRLARQVFYHLNFLALAIFQIESYIFAQGWPYTMILLCLHIAGMPGIYPYTRLICWDGVLLVFCPCWPWTVIFLITFQVMGLTQEMAKSRKSGRKHNLKGK